MSYSTNLFPFFLILFFFLYIVTFFSLRYVSVALFIPVGRSLKFAALCLPGKGDPGCFTAFKFNGGKGFCAARTGEPRPAPIFGVVLPPCVDAGALGTDTEGIPTDAGREPEEPELTFAMLCGCAGSFALMVGVDALSASHAKACTVNVFTWFAHCGDSDTNFTPGYSTPSITAVIALVFVQLQL